MTTVVIVRHAVEDFDKWKPVFDEHRTAREAAGAGGHTVAVSTDEPGVVLVINEFPNRAAADRFATDPSLPEAMARAGVVGAPRIEFYELSEHVDY